MQTSGKEFHPILVKTGNELDAVTGTVFDLTADELALADSYEVAEYQRCAATLSSGRTAWIYADARQTDRQQETICLD